MKIAAAQLLMKSNIKPAVSGAMDKVVKSIVLKTALICANRSSSFRETTTIQSFSRMILDPTDATWAMSAKRIVTTFANVGTHEGQCDSPI